MRTREQRLAKLERVREEQEQRPRITGIIVHLYGADPDIVTYEEMMYVHGRWVPYQERCAPLGTRGDGPWHVATYRAVWQPWSRP